MLRLARYSSFEIDDTVARPNLQLVHLYLAILAHQFCQMLGQFVIIELFQVRRQTSCFGLFSALFRLAKLPFRAFRTFRAENCGGVETKPIFFDGLATVRAGAVGARLDPRKSVIDIPKPPLLALIQSLQRSGIALLLRLFLDFRLPGFRDRPERLIIVTNFFDQGSTFPL